MKPPPVPEPRLRSVLNRTRFAHFSCDKMGAGRRFFDTVVVKGTFTLAPGKLVRATEQAEIALSDAYRDPASPDRSSLERAGDALLVKPSTDVMVTGTARPSDVAQASWEASVVVRRGDETLIDCRADVFGQRFFQHGENGWGLTDPEPATEVPIRYELAYGGAYPAPDSAEQPWVVHAANPSGMGFFDERALDPAVAYRAPQWQRKGHPVTAPNVDVPLAGFGPVARSWASRLQYAGTYDAAWQRSTRADIENGLPADYAADFDPRFFQCAPEGLVSPSYLEGKERITLGGLVPGPTPLEIALPGIELGALLVDGRGARHTERLRLDTVHVDLDAAAVYVCWRLTLDQARDLQSAVIVEREMP